MYKLMYVQPTIISKNRQLRGKNSFFSSSTDWLITTNVGQQVFTEQDIIQHRKPTSNSLIHRASFYSAILQMHSLFLCCNISLQNLSLK